METVGSVLLRRISGKIKELVYVKVLCKCREQGRDGPSGRAFAGQTHLVIV